MRNFFCLVLLLTAAGAVVGQEPVPPKATPDELEAQRIKWGLSEEQFLLVDRSRRPGGDTYDYWKARGRGPHGNLLERVPGGPRRPVKI
jgi:hypothetical protein